MGAIIGMVIPNWERASQPIDGTRKVLTIGEIQNSDLNFKDPARRSEYLFKTPVLSPMLMRHLKDERDEPMVHLTLNIVFWLSIYVSLMFYLAKDPQTQMYVHALGCLNIAMNYAGLLPRFLLMLHYSAHRSAWKEGWLNAVNGWILAPFYGVPCGLYYLHHCVMHHIENNHGLDLSATDAYQRDSLLHFAIYWFRFTFGIWIEIPLYCIRSKRLQWLSKVAMGIAFWLTAILCTSMVAGSSSVAVWLFVVPFFASFLPMSFGNWGQHIFVDPDNCRSNYALTYNCIDSPYNQLAFNDGYHIIHHANARLHWSEMPTHFHDTLQKHHQEGAITFRVLDFFLVAVLVMCGQLRLLASDYYVHLGDKESAPTVDEMEAKFKRWLLPFNPDKLPADPNAGKKEE